MGTNISLGWRRNYGHLVIVVEQSDNGSNTAADIWLIDQQA